MKSSNYYFQISEYIQIACSGRHSVEITVFENNTETGKIIIEEGTLINASDKTGEGEDAFKRLILKKNVQITLNRLSENKNNRIIKTDCEELIFKIFTTKDKENSLKMNLSEKRKSLSDFELKTNFGLGQLLDKDYKNALSTFKELDKESPGNIRITTILTRLKEIGIK